jgi:uncharacterized membrane protein YfcA
VSTSSRHAWRLGLVVVVALLYAWIGLSAGTPDSVAGVGGAVLIVAALVLERRSRPVTIALLLVGAVPLAVLTWWSLVTPLLAVLCLLLGRPGTTPRTSLPPIPAGRS